MNNVYIVETEPLESRYTYHWIESIPREIKKAGYKPICISGEIVSKNVSNSNFLDFSNTNVYKSSQLNQISKLFSEKKIKNNDIFLFTDAWNPTIISLRYMSILNKIPIKIIGMWHAGSYDPYDLLGQTTKIEKKVFSSIEQSLINCIDLNWFATKFHLELVKKSLIVNNYIVHGFPFEFYDSIINNYVTNQKEDIILFPHRISPEKQPDIFKDLQNSNLPWKFIICQESKLSKNEYYNLLAKSKLVFSASKQETLGIGCVESFLFGGVSLVPDRLSYQEMYLEEYKYPSNWTDDFNSYLQNKNSIIERIRLLMQQSKDLDNTQKNLLKNDFFSTDFNVIFNKI